MKDKASYLIPTLKVLHYVFFNKYSGFSILPYVYIRYLKRTKEVDSTSASASPTSIKILSVHCRERIVRAISVRLRFVCLIVTTRPSTKQKQRCRTAPELNAIITCLQTIVQPIQYVRKLPVCDSTTAFCLPPTTSLFVRLTLLIFPYFNFE